MAKSSQPNYYKNSRIMREHLESNAKIQAELDSKIGYDRKRFSAITTVDLTSAELDVGVTPDENLSPEFRRARIIAKLRAMPYANKQKIIDIASAFWPHGVELTEINEEYRIIVYLLRGQPSLDDLEIIRREIAEIIPAHLQISASEWFMTWAYHDSLDYTCEQWDDLDLTCDEWERYHEGGNTYAIIKENTDRP